MPAIIVKLRPNVWQGEKEIGPGKKKKKKREKIRNSRDSTATAEGEGGKRIGKRGEDEEENLNMYWGAVSSEKQKECQNCGKIRISH